MPSRIGRVAGRKVTAGSSLKKGAALSLSQRIRAIRPGALLAHWPLAEPTGTQATDESGAGRHGAYHGGCTLGATGAGDGRTSVLLDGIDGYIDLLTAGLATAFDGNAGTVAIRGRMNAGTWTDGLPHLLIHLYGDGSNSLYLLKTSANVFRFRRVTPTADRQYEHTVSASSSWFRALLTWSTADDELRCYWNGQHVQTLTGIGTYTAGLILAVAGVAYIEPITSPYLGNQAHVALWNAALTPAQAALY